MLDFSNFKMRGLFIQYLLIENKEAQNICIDNNISGLGFDYDLYQICIEDCYDT